MVLSIKERGVMMPVVRGVFLSLLVLILVGCSGSPYKTDFDSQQGADFSKYSTFTWRTPVLEYVEPQLRNPLMEGRLKESAKRAMESAGFRYVENTAEADLAIAFAVGERERITIDRFPDHYHHPSRFSFGFGYSHGGHHGLGVGISTSSQIDQYTESMLAMDFYETASQNPVGHAVGRWAQRNREPEERLELLNNLMTDLVAKIAPAVEI